MKNNVRRLAYLILAGLGVICVYLALIPLYIDYVAGNNTVPADPRIAARESQIKRGDILDRRGNILACSVPVENGYTREYPLGSAAAHVVGYNSSKYGAAGIEKNMAKVLLGLEGGNDISALRNRILGHPGMGNDVTLTIDAELQKSASDLLGGQKGAIVVLDPTTGEVLAMASYPNYDPAQVAGYMNQPDSPMLNRAAQGAYPPGSVFKVVTAAALLSELPKMARDNIDCTGQLKVTGFTLRDNAVHGTVDFRKAFAQSCNVAFGRYGLAVGNERFVRQAGAFGIGKQFEFPLPVYNGHITPAGKMDGPNLASSAIGQGELLISPLQAVLLAAAVANDGIIMKPYLISSYSNAKGGQINMQPRQWLKAMEPEVAAALTEEMIAVVREGTGKAAALPGITVAGKTGSAENPHGRSHAWFVGFAPAHQPRVAVAVLLENAGSGGAVAAPIAREVFRRALDLLDS
ncbi:peptidoglycan D,D-transpeptidase FtsI family protein [Desulfallas thermosapovorans]|uniref:Peptidoglycan glycosyltransferase n=1 Tax=Desulfallas thermosapovorans DSM 6562 TaxID=1121431 RepID=A0A5S4ZXE1_9FIRM|nr:penicillin-binding protein 2 [Desulfallas thermosapovorans]TYO97380.1 peptidoglycan glycosyltransferase [Desulfallas thermosapovorans DSM 6562]